MPALKYAALIWLLVSLLLLSEPLPTWETANAYAREYRKWAELRNVRVQSPGTISAPELLGWSKVKAAWRVLEKQVDAEYRGER